MIFGKGQENLIFTNLFKYINQFPGQRLQKSPKNPSLSHFSIKMLKFQNLTLPKNRSSSNKGHNLNKLVWTGVPDATYQVSL